MNATKLNVILITLVSIIVLLFAFFFLLKSRPSPQPQQQVTTQTSPNTEKTLISVPTDDSSFPQVAQGTMKSFTGPDYTFNYPEDWDVEESSANGAPYYTFGKTMNKTNLLPYLFVEQLPQSTYDLVLPANIKQGFSKSTVTVDGVQSVQLDRIGSGNNAGSTRYKSFLTFVKHNNGYYLLELSAPEQYSQDVTALNTKILSSFHFTK